MARGNELNQPPSAIGIAAAVAVPKGDAIRCGAPKDVLREGVAPALWADVAAVRAATIGRRV